jgi:VanZ family protein
MIPWFEKHNTVSLLITALIAIFIFYMSSLSFSGYPGIGSSNRAEFYHFSIFFIFGFFLLISLVKGKNKNLFFLGIFIGVLYGISDEVHQLFVPMRNCSLQDMLIDSIAILFAGIIYLLLIKTRKSKF